MMAEGVEALPGSSAANSWRTFMGTVGLNWQFSGVGGFSSRGTRDLLLRERACGPS